MKVCIWFGVTDQPWGGGNQFLRALSGALKKAGHTVSHIPENSDVVLINSHNIGPNHLLYPGMVAQVRQIGHSTKPWHRFVPAWLWMMILRRRGPIIVHRLDGVAELVRGKRTIADQLIPPLNRLTDYTIFQSQYSCNSFFSYGVRPKHSSIIFNGVDGDKFYPLIQKKLSVKKFRLIAVSWSPNPRKGFATLAKVSRIPEIEVYFAGRWPDAIDPLDVKLLGEKTSAELAEYMRESDAMIHAAENEPCSNAIIESLACGLPILYLDSGGNHEIAGEYGIAISNDLRNDVDRLRANYLNLREKIIASRTNFLIGPVAKKYINAFEAVLQLRDIQ